jgi:hypothetical protein
MYPQLKEKLQHLVDHIDQVLESPEHLAVTPEPTPTLILTATSEPTPTLTPTATASPTPTVTTQPQTESEAGNRGHSRNVLDRTGERLRDIIATPDQGAMLPISAAAAQEILKNPHRNDVSSLLTLLDDTMKGQPNQDLPEVDTDGDGIPDFYLTPDGQIDLHPDREPKNTVPTHRTETGSLDGDDSPDYDDHRGYDSDDAPD